MHPMIEAARKSAGISDLKTRNYPSDPKQRGAGFWAAFVGSLDTSIQRLVSESDDEIKKLSRENLQLQKEVEKARKQQMENGVEAIALSEGWSHDKRTETVRKIAG